MDFDTRKTRRRAGSGGLWVTLAAGALVGAAGYALLPRHRAPGHPADGAPGRTARRQRFDGYAVTGRTVTIARPRGEIYAFWRDPANLAGFMENVEAAAASGPDTWRWTIRAPAGRTVSVETRIVDDREGERIAWRSVPGSEIDTEGKISFRDAPGGRGTEVEAIIAYRPPAGAAGRWIAKAFRREPAIQGRHELKRLKMLLETGEIATSRRTRADARA